MPPTDDFYRRERQRQRDPLALDTSTHASKSVAGEKDGLAAEGLSISAERRDSTHLPNALVQERAQRPYMPSRSLTAPSTGPVPGFMPARSLQIADHLPIPVFPPQRNKGTSTSPKISDPANTDMGTLGRPSAAHMSKPLEKATDPRRRQDLNSLSVHPIAALSPGGASPPAIEPPKKSDQTSCLGMAASAASSPMPSDDINMFDISDSSPASILTGALNEFILCGVDVGIYRHMRSQARKELEEATKEHQRVRDSLRSYPPLLEQTEYKKRIAEQGYKTINSRLIRSNQSLDNKAANLVNILVSQIAQASTLSTADSDHELVSLHTEFKPWFERLKSLEESVASGHLSRETIKSLESRLDVLEFNSEDEHTKLFSAEAEKLWKADQKTSELLQASINNVSSRFANLYEDINQYQAGTSEVIRPLVEDVQHLLKYAKDNKSDVGNLTKSNRELAQLTKDDIRVLFQRDAERDAEISRLQQENHDVWTAHNALRDKIAAQHDVESLRTELNSCRERGISRTEFDSMRQTIQELQRNVPTARARSPQPKSIDIPNSILSGAIQSPIRPILQASLQPELDLVKQKMTNLEGQLATLLGQTIPQAKFNEYVKRYQHDNADIKTRLSVVEEAQTGLKSELLWNNDDHASTLSQQVQRLTGQVDQFESKISAQQAATALMEQRLDKSTSARESANAPTHSNPSIETELRSTIVIHTQRLEQLQSQINHFGQALQSLTQKGVSQSWAETTDQKIKDLQEMVTPLTNTIASIQKTANSGEHSIKALTSRYNNLTSEQFSKRMANHLNPLAATLQAEQNVTKGRLDSLESQNLELNKALGSIHATVSEHTVHIADERASRDKFEIRLKTKYYDVLEDKATEARRNIEGDLIKKGSDIETIKTALEAHAGRLEEIERQSLLYSFQQPVTQKPSPSPEIGIRDQSERSELHENSQRSLTDKIEHSHVQSNGKRRSFNHIEDSITARATSSSRKKPKFMK